MTNSGEATLLAGRYRLVREIGSGAMGTVWQAVDERLGRQVAVKRLLLPANPDAAAQARERAHREGRIAARLHHPNAVTVHDVVEHDGLPVLVMEFFPGRSLADVLATDGPLPPYAAAALGAQVASALAAAHDAGVVHRDVKPANVLLGPDGTAKLVDFGIAHAGGDIAVTQAGLVAGTPAYLAPEVACGQPSTSASDVFSLGSLLFAAVEGTPPFGEREENTLGVLRRVAEGVAAPARRAGPLAPMLARLLVSDPAARPPAAAVRDELKALAFGTAPVPAVRPEELTQPLRAVPAGPPPSGTRLDLRPLDAPPSPVPAHAPVAEAPPRSRRAVFAALGGGLVVVAAGITIAVASSGEQAAAPPSPAPSTTASSPQPLSSAELLGVVGDHYGHLPGDPPAAYALLGPALRAQGEEAFATRWSEVREVTVVSAPRVNGTDTVHVGIRLVLRSGATVTEYHQHGIGRHEGAIVILSDTLLHAETTAPPPKGDREGRDEDDRKDDEKEDKEEGKKNKKKKDDD
ncbi:serine/threonine-protein kinase [Saccharomonospora xinjiangensis]|uniref:serine/threonine-protein kinase n=1 Tax=Saccharomonospora xinjiangensis TaxID=75294 RepID=UPI001FFDDB82|nr:serine/threonine-protein kinase [Saccharomonospora xinjiangensis]